MAHQTLKQAGLKATSPRIRILKILENAHQKLLHMSAEDVYQQIRLADEDIGLATVYRVLTQFEAAGLVKRLHFTEGRSVFELNQGKHHDHLVCVNCGKIQEFVDAIIENKQLEIAKKANFYMTDHALNIFGFCADCHPEL